MQPQALPSAADHEFLGFPARSFGFGPRTLEVGDGHHQIFDNRADVEQ